MARKGRVAGGVAWVAASLLLLGAAGAAAAEHAEGHAEQHAGSEAVTSEHAASEHAAAAGGGHAAAHEHHQEFNWYQGMLGEKAGEEPSLLWRTPGTPAPFLAQLFNTLLLVLLFVRFGSKPLARGLADRRQRILKGIEDASAMQKEATEQLRVYRNKLDNLDAEIERVKREMRESAETERRRVLEEAGVRRTRLEQEARVLIERELEALREQLTRETALAALDSARELLKRSVSTDDHRRLCEEYLHALPPAAGGLSAGRGSEPSAAVEAPRSVIQPSEAP